MAEYRNRLESGGAHPARVTQRTDKDCSPLLWLWPREIRVPPAPSRWVAATVALSAALRPTRRLCDHFSNLDQGTHELARSLRSTVNAMGQHGSKAGLCVWPTSA